MISAGANLGFSGGMNVGIREARRRGATHVLLVNSDAVLPPSTLRTLLEAMRERPNSGIVGPLVLARSQPDTIATAGMTFSPVTGRMRHPESGKSFAATPLAIWKEVAGVSGCAMLIADAVFERIGLLPEPYFFSLEDLAFCLSARDAGFGVGICGNALAYHEGSRTLGATSARRLYFGTRNQLLLSAERPAGGVLHRFARAGAIIAFNVLYALRATGDSFASRLLAVARGTRDHLARRYGSDERDRETSKSPLRLRLREVTLQNGGPSVPPRTVFQIPHFGRQQPDFLDQTLDLLTLPRDRDRKIQQRGEHASDEREQQDGRGIVNAKPGGGAMQTEGARKKGRTVPAPRESTAANTLPSACGGAPVR